MFSTYIKLLIAFGIFFGFTKLSKGQNQGNNIGDISRQKCKEYAKYAYDDPDSQNKELHCTFTVKSHIEDVESTASVSEFPHVVQLGYESPEGTKWLCGGSLISEQYVLTAAHCLLTREYGKPKYVALGLTHINDQKYRKEVPIAEVTNNLNYVAPAFYNDLGLVKLSQEVDFTPRIRPACLNSEFAISNEKALVSGWGKIDFLGERSEDMLKRSVEFVDQPTCDTFYKNIRSLTRGIDDNILICAKLSTKNSTNCQGESGSPLQLYGGDDVPCTYNIVGVASFGRGCNSDNPDGYLRVSAYLKWIEETVWPHERTQDTEETDERVWS